MKLREVMERPKLLVPIAPSGAGKSTIFNKLKAQNPNINIFSLDLLRHKLYDKDDYAKAWKMSTEDPQFSQKANIEFYDLLKQKKDLYVDNTNLTPKSRRKWINAARQHGYKIIGITFDVDVEELVKRQTTRSDKSVPEQAVRQQHEKLVGPQEGEFDKIISSESIK